MASIPPALEQSELGPAATIDQQLDEALEMTFPASDPVSIGVPRGAQPVREFDEKGLAKGG